MGLLDLLITLICVQVAISTDKVPLRFRSDGTFKIVQFTDLHYGEGVGKDINSSIVQSTILAAEEPDIVILTGDMVSGYAWNGSHGWFAKRWQQLTTPMIKANIPYALALGNHDDEADLTRDEIIKLDQQIPLSYTQRGPLNITGASNYVLPIYSSTSQSTNPEDLISNLWIFDSGDDNCLNIPGWDCVHPDQIEWYRSTSNSFREQTGKIIPGLSFFHIPVPEFMDVFNYEETYGLLRDTGVCCFSINTGLYAAVIAQGDIVSMHCGHDHDNDFWGSLFNVTLAYGRKTGYGGYGPPPGWLRGARVIEITENPFTMTHWIRQEDGTKINLQVSHAPGTNQTFHCCDAFGKEEAEFAMHMLTLEDEDPIIQTGHNDL